MQTLLDSEVFDHKFSYSVILQTVPPIVRFCNPEAAVVTEIHIVERGVIIYSTKVGKETVSGIANMTIENKTLYLREIHLKGSSSGKFGRGGLNEMFKSLGRQYGVEEVFVQGGKRTTGKI